MTTNQFSNANTFQTLNWRRVGLGLTAVTLLLLIGTAVSLLLSPIGRRWQANQTAVAPTVGVTDILVVADSELNHVFAPAVTQVEVGTAVTWHFQEIDEEGDPVAHNVVFEQVESPVQSDGTFTVTFDEPGTYPYVCTLHPFMEGAVVVTTANN
ncbi:MAG: plastocyanin/azurin family copper-binding protein [Chloroflexota bacterium]